MDVFLAVAALFATAGTLGIHAAANLSPDSVPTPCEVATVTGQGAAVVGQAALVSGEMGWLNFLSPSFRDLTEAEKMAITEEMQITYDSWYAGLDRQDRILVDSVHGMRKRCGSNDLDYQQRLIAREDQVGEFPPNPTLDPGSVPDKSGSSPVQDFFAPSVGYLSAALTFVDAVTMLFGAFEQPVGGQKINGSLAQLATGSLGLGSALPDPDKWFSQSALLYGIDTKILQQIAVAAWEKDARLKRIIDAQHFNIELMQAALAGITLGLVICVYLALYWESIAPGSSLIFQKRMAALATVATIGIGVTMIVWVGVDTGRLTSLNTEYNDLADKIPDSVPPYAPSMGSLSLASPVSMFGELNLAAMSDGLGASIAAKKHYGHTPTAPEFVESWAGLAASEFSDINISRRKPPPLITNSSPLQRVSSLNPKDSPLNEKEELTQTADTSQGERVPVDIAALSLASAATPLSEKDNT